MATKHAIAVFDSKAMAALRTELAKPEYQTPEATLLLLQEARSYTLQPQDADGNAPGGINDSRPCPGSPGCP